MKKVKKLKIMTYNTHLFKNTVNPNQYDEEVRLNNIIEKIKRSNCDIIGLNEVWADSTKEKIIRESEIPYVYSYYKKTSSSDMGSGLLLLSKNMILNANFIQYQDSTGWDKLAQKGIIIAEVFLGKEYQKQQCHVIITHLQSGKEGEDERVRGLNIEQLWSVIRGCPFGDNPLLVFGDYNVVEKIDGGHQTGEYLKLKQSFGALGLKDMFRIVNPEKDGFTLNWYENSLAKHFNPKERLRQRLDYFFIKNINFDQSSIEVKHNYKYEAEKDLSDHYPVTCEFIG